MKHNRIIRLVLVLLVSVVQIQSSLCADESSRVEQNATRKIDQRTEELNEKDLLSEEQKKALEEAREIIRFLNEQRGLNAEGEKLNYTNADW